MSNFNGIFKNELESFIEYKNTNGFYYESAIFQLRLFDRFTIERNINNKILTKELILDFIYSKENIKDRTKGTYASLFRQFALYLNIIDIEAYVLPEEYFSAPYDFHPYIYSDDEIKRIFEAIENGYLKKYPRKQEQVRLIVLLLFKTGMRISEVLNIKRKNIDYENNTILVEETKNGSDRLITVNDKMIKELYDFEVEYNNKFDYFFEKNNQQLYSRDSFNAIFRRLLFAAKIMHTENGPRVHDARHTFCVNSLKQAIENNYDLNNFIPILSTYVGHQDLDSTYKYLRLTCDLFPNIREKAQKIINLKRNDIHYEEL